MNESFSQKHEISKALVELKLSIFDTLIHDKIWNRVANDILKTPSFDSSFDKRNNLNTLSMIRLLPSYENLLINFKEKLLNIINSCQPNDYEDLMTTLYNQLECNDNNESNKHPNDLLQLMPSSSSNQYTKQSISDHNDNVSENNHFSSDETKLKTKSSRRYSTFSNSSSVCIPSNSSSSFTSFCLSSSSSSSSSTEGSSLTLCPISSPSLQPKIMSNTLKQQINKIPHHQKNKHKDVKKSHRHEIHNDLSEQNSSKDLFQRPSLDSPSNIHNAIYSFSDADSTFSSCLNNVEFTVMNQDQLISLASALDSRSSRLDCRQKALKQLVHLPIIDVQACEVWIYLNQNIASQSPPLMKTTSFTTQKQTTRKTVSSSSSSSFSLVSQDRSTTNNNNNNNNNNNLPKLYSVTNTPDIVDQIKVENKTPRKLPSSASSLPLSSSLKSKTFSVVQHSMPTEENLSTDDNHENNKNISIRTTSKNNNDSNSHITNNMKMITTGGLRRGLADALNDEDDILWSLSLRYISKGLSTTPPNIRETYSLLIEYLQLQFTKNAHHYPFLKDGVDFQQNHNKRVLRACYLMNKFHQTIPFYWIRYSEQFVNEIIGKCLNILSIGCEQFNHEQNYHQLRLTPFHLFSLVDCEAKWFIQSSHGTYCCNALIVQLKNNYELFEFSVLICLIYMNKNNANNVVSLKYQACTNDPNNKYYYTYKELIYTSFLHAIHIICRVLCFSHGRNLFPLKLKQSKTITLINVNQPITVNLFLCTMLQFLHRTIFAVEEIHQTYHPFMVIKNCLTKLTLYEAVSRNCFTSDNLSNKSNLSNFNIIHVQQPLCLQSSSSSTTVEEDDYINLLNSKGDSSSFISLLIKYLIEFSLNKDTMKIELMDLHKFEIFVEVFQNILSHKTGQIILQNLISKPLNLISNLLDFTMKLLYQSMEMKNLSSSVDEYYVLLLNILIKIIHCGQHLTKRGTSSHFEDIHDFNSVLIKMWYQITETKLMSEINFNRIQENFLKDFQNCLIYSLGSPIGVELFTKSNLLINFTKFLQKYLVNEHNISFRRPHTCGFLFSQLALNKSSLLALSQSGIISLLVKHAWQSIEYFDSTGHVNLTGNYSTVKTYNPPIWSIDPIDKIAYKPFVNLVRVTTSYECVENLLNPMDLLTNKEYYDFRLDIPTNLPEFFDRVIFVNNNMAKLNSLFNPDQCQVFGLRLLSCIISCLDSLLWFEAYLNLSDYLLNCQNMEEYLPTNVNVMYDTLTIERNYLLMKIFFIGGPTERELPPRILCQHTNNIYPFIMIQSKPVYDNYYYCTTPEGSTRIDNKCKQYPCINWYNEMFPTASIKSQLLTNLLQIELINQPITSFKAAMEWTNQCQTILKNYNGIMKRGEFNLEKKNTLIGNFLDQCLLTMNYMDESNSCLQSLVKANTEEINGFTLSKMDEIAVDWTIRYGLRIGSLPPIFDSNEVTYSEQYKFYSEQFRKLLCTIRLAFNIERQSTNNNQKLSTDEPFDWFVATIFLIYQGNNDHAWNFLCKYSSFLHSLYLWPNRCRNLVKYHNLFYIKSCQYFEHLLALECPNVFNTFVMAEMSPAQIYLRWTNQCYWNYFDWINIVNYIIVCLLHPIHFQLYLNLCIIQHLNPALLHITNEQSTNQKQQPEQLIIFLQEEPIRGFDYLKHFSYMYELNKKYTEHLDMYKLN
ncbi:unnamed protein product [Schistosoma rodhaini]|uniref:Protein broad-minded n=1 Tax=Schistosoma rodhaini TaxID=6188 RepID=A0AA85GBB0_9TREM|nr:unnamed protein product [Schistosoma rodhaini]